MSRVRPNLSTFSIAALNCRAQLPRSIAAMKASAVTGPPPGTLIDRQATSLRCASSLSWSSSLATCAAIEAKASSNATMPACISGSACVASSAAAANFFAPTREERAKNARRKPYAEGAQQPAHRVAERALRLDQLVARSEKRRDPVAVDRLHVDGREPAR